MDYSELNTTQRIAFVVFSIMIGESFTSAELAERLDMSRQGAWAMMTKLSLILPIYQNDDNVWVKVDNKPQI